MAFSIQLSRIGNIRIDKSGATSLDKLIHKSLKEKLNKGDAESLDILHDVLMANPETHRVLETAARRLTEPANIVMADAMEATGKTLNDQESFSLNDNFNPDSVVSRSVKIPGTYVAAFPKKTPSRPWKNLSLSTLKRIGFYVHKRKRGGGYTVSGSARSYNYGGKHIRRPVQGKKRFWYERRRRGSAMRSSAGGSLGGTAIEKTKEFSAALRLGARQAVSVSEAGIPDYFTLDINTRRRRARTYGYRTKKGKLVVVYGVSGSMYYPTVLTVGSTLRRTFSAVTLGSMNLATAIPPQVSGKAMFSSAGEADKWLAVLLQNERKRPWLGPWFSQLERPLIQYMQQELRQAVGYQAIIE